MRRDSPGPTVEQRDAKLFFQGGDSLTHGRLGDAQVGRGGREAPQLGRLDERAEMREFVRAQFDHDDTEKNGAHLCMRE